MTKADRFVSFGLALVLCLIIPISCLADSSEMKCVGTQKLVSTQMLIGDKVMELYLLAYPGVDSSQKNIAGNVYVFHYVDEYGSTVPMIIDTVYWVRNGIANYPQIRIVIDNNITEPELQYWTDGDHFYYDGHNYHFNKWSCTAELWLVVPSSGYLYLSANPNYSNAKSK